MAAEVNISVRLVEGLHFVGANEAGLSINLDSLADGPAEGPSPMALVLMSLAGCSGMDVIAIMRKKRQPVEAFEVVARGARADEYPRPYTKIMLEFRFTGTGIDPRACERAIELSRDSYCPVWAMLGATVDIGYTYTISAP